MPLDRAARSDEGYQHLLTPIPKGFYALLIGLLVATRNSILEALKAGKVSMPS